MTTTKTHPEIEVLCYPASAIPHRTGNGFVIFDILGDRMNLGQGDGGGIAFQDQNPTISDSWIQANSGQDAFDSITKCDFVRFQSDGVFREGASTSGGGNKDISGFILEGRVALLDCKIGDTQLNTNCIDLNWKINKGKWQTVLPPESPQRTRILNTGSDLTAVAQTVGTLPANRSVQYDVRFLAHKMSGPQAACRLTIGGDTYALVAKHGMKWTVEKYVNGAWKILRKLDAAPVCNLSGGRYVLQFRRMAGRLVVSVNGHSFWFLEMERETTPGSRAKAVDAFWPEGPLGVRAYNVRAQIGVGTIKYAQASGALFSGSFSRTIARKTPVSSDGAPLVGGAGGWRSAGAGVTVTPSLAPGAVLYSCALTASPDGIDTPFVNKVFARFEPLWGASDSAPLDIAPAVARLNVSTASPPIMAGSEVTISVDRVVLDALQSNWGNWVQNYNPASVRVRWRYSDDSVDAWVKLFTGYIYKTSKSSGSATARTMTLTLRDPILRLQKPAAPIDHRYPPLDVFFGLGSGAPFYGTDGVREILNYALGPDEGDLLNAGGDYFPASHYPLISTDNDEMGYFSIPSEFGGPAPPTSNGMRFPPPFGDDALGWINKLAKDDHAVFFYGWPGGYAGDWPVPCYGRLLNFIAGRAVKTICDVCYIASDINRLLLSSETETRPDRDINRILVWSNMGQNALADYLPATRMAEARLDPDDINAPEKSWERTLILREEFGSIPGGAEALAMGVASELKNRVLEWPRLTCRGDATLHWGDKVTARMDSTDCALGLSDASLGLGNKIFRVEGVDHSIDMASVSVDSFTSKLRVRPVSASGW